MREESPCSSQIPMGIPPRAGYPSWCLHLLFEHMSVLFLPSNKRGLPHVRISWGLHQHEQGNNPPEHLRCLVGAMERKESSGLPDPHAPDTVDARYFQNGRQLL